MVGDLDANAPELHDATIVARTDAAERLRSAAGYRASRDIVAVDVPGAG